MDLKDYTKVNWQNYPALSSPVSANNLNHMDNQIKTNQMNIKELSTSAILKVVNGKVCVEVNE